MTDTIEVASERFGDCALCGNAGERIESHIYPKFVFRWFKKTSVSPDFRGAHNPDAVLQDGPRLYALCEICEQDFSRRETWFANSVFYPYLGRAVVPQRQHDSRLFYFLVSLAWRLLVLAGAVKDTSLPNHDRLLLAEQEWRKYLLEGERPATFNVFHLILANPDDAHNFPVKALRGLNNFHRWFKRNIDGTVVSWEGRTMLFLKLPGIVIFVPITPFDPKYLEGTLVALNEGRIAKRQRLRDHWLLSILEQRAEYAHNHISTLSQSQLDREWKTFRANPKADGAAQLLKDVSAAKRRLMRK